MSQTQTTAAVLAPVLMGILALVASDPFARRWGFVPMLLGVVAYFAFPKRKPLVERSVK